MGAKFVNWCHGDPERHTNREGDVFAFAIYLHQHAWLHIRVLCNKIQTAVCALGHSAATLTPEQHPKTVKRNQLISALKKLVAKIHTAHGGTWADVIVNFDKLEEIQTDLEIFLFNTGAPQEAINIAVDPGRLAAALGYDAIYVPSQGYTVILNRGATYVRSTT